MTSKTQRLVTVSTITTGTNFAHVGVVRAVRGGRKLATTRDCYGAAEGAERAAARIAKAKGWRVVSSEDGE